MGASILPSPTVVNQISNDFLKENLRRLVLLCLNAPYNNISVIPWRLVLLVEETGVPGENHRPVACH